MKHRNWYKENPHKVRYRARGDSFGASQCCRSCSMEKALNAAGYCALCVREQEEAEKPQETQKIETSARTKIRLFKPNKKTRLKKWNGGITICKYCDEDIVPVFGYRDCWKHVADTTCSQAKPESDTIITYYKAGQRFKHIASKSIYVLAVVGQGMIKDGTGYERYWSLIDIDAGVHWSTAIPAGHTENRIHEECFNKIINNKERDFEALPERVH